jgi:ABC-2 type transport system ATP-binding protein
MVIAMSEASRTAAPLKITRLAKEYVGGRGVHDISFTVAPGSVTGFIGANGAGKSTTLKCIVGLTQPDAGTIEIFGRPADFASRSRWASSPRNAGLAPRERARDAIAFHARLKGLDRSAAYVQADRLLERIGLGARLRTRIGELSKGNAQRVQILCAIAHKPDLLILDEPFSGLDPVAQAEVQSLFSEYRAGGGAILFSTHSMSAAERPVRSGGGGVRRPFRVRGRVAEAAAHAPHGVYVTCADAVALMEVVAELGGDAQAFPGKMGESLRWRVLLPKDVTYPALMRAMAERQLAVHGFDPIQADLEGAFWSLAARKEAA